MTNQPHILHVFDNFRVGGTEVRTCRIINGLGSAFRHTIVSMRGNFAAAGLIDPAVAIDYVHPQNLSDCNRLQLLLRINQYLRQTAPHLLVAYDWGAIDWAMSNVIRRVCRCVMTIEGFEESELFRQQPKRWLLRRLFYPRCDQVVGCSTVLCTIARDSWGVRAPGKLLHIPNGIDCTQFQPSPGKQDQPDQDQPGREVVLGIVGSLIKLKNHALLLESMALAAAKVPLRLVIVGEGPERANLEQRCVELGIAGQVSFTGLLENPASVLQDLDIYCLASITEQMPMVVLEAMATGLPVVGTDVGDVREMVAEANKPFIVPSGDAQQYAQALETLARDAVRRKELGQANLEKCREQYDERLMVERYRELYLQTGQ
ncbi:glycosyltransferase family 4 protein [Desulfonatronum thioautotrophicum]|uniref:glycosyltransferase family 4 protein n=1 Tax=Desulfonatronum thioautotrophicum TaxID=617001 RepID=UPI00069A5905|nr:glycosyltransferase family 4 protein [Desulfonatronum thioautotrophicum]